MELKVELMRALKESMQQKDTLRKDTITMLRAAILQIEKDTQKELTEDEMLTVVSKEVKKRREAIPEYEKGGRQDIVQNLDREIKILSTYMPKQLSEEEITKIIVDAITATGATSMKDMGKVMGAIKDKTAGKADGKLVSDIVKAKLSI